MKALANPHVKYLAATIRNAKTYLAVHRLLQGGLPKVLHWGSFIEF